MLFKIVPNVCIKKWFEILFSDIKKITTIHQITSGCDDGFIQTRWQQ